MRKKHPAPLPRASIRRAFTLIELLVVIAIIAILAAILFPVFAQAKRAAKVTADLSNIKQIALASELWKADHEGYLVQASYNYQSNGQPTGLQYPFGSWRCALAPYVKSKDLFKSPLDPGLKMQGLGTGPDDHSYGCDVFDTSTGYCAIDPATNDYYWKDTGALGARSTDDDFASSYRLNSSNQPGYRTDDPSIHFRTSLNESAIDQLSSAILIIPSGKGVEQDPPYDEVTTADAGYTNDIACINDVTNVEFDRSNPVGANPSKSARNGGRANYGFGDGHAKNMAWSQTWRSIGSVTKDSRGDAVVPTMWRQSFTGAPDFCKTQENDPR